MSSRPSNLQLAQAKVRLDLLSHLHQVEYRLSPLSCSFCGKIFLPLAIIDYFREQFFEGYDYCANCGELNYVLDKAWLAVSETEYYEVVRPEDVLIWLVRFRRCPPRILWLDMPGLCHNAIVYFGTVRQAMVLGTNGKYDFDENLAWSEKIDEYLGILPDGVVADCVGVKVTLIRNLRKRAGQSACRAGRTLAKHQALPPQDMSLDLPVGVAVKRGLPRSIK